MSKNVQINNKKLQINKKYGDKTVKFFAYLILDLVDINYDFKDVERMRDVGNVISVPVSFVQVDVKQSNRSMLGEDKFKYPLPWKGKISQKPHPRANNDNQIPTPCPAPPPPPPPAGFKLIGALPRTEVLLKLFGNLNSSMLVR